MSNILRRLNKVIDTLNSAKLTDVAYKKFVELTPEKTGNAKRKTRKTQNSIEANYPYANVLDAGRGKRDGQMRGSDQAPKGMTKPTIEHIRNYVYQKTGIKLK